MKTSIKIMATLSSFLASSLNVYALAVSPVPETSTPFPDLGGLIGQIFTVVLILAGILLFIFLLIGGLQWVTSGGDKMALEAARGKITAAVTGLVIIVAAFALTRILEAAFGFRVLSGINIPEVTSPLD